jgi:predicted RNase H-like HicB family nuclease
MKSKDYPIVLVYSDDEEAWLARVDQLPGLVVDGETPEKALAHAKAAILEWIDTSKELGREVPPPLSEEQINAFLAQQNAAMQEAFKQGMAMAEQRQSVGDIGKRPHGHLPTIPSVRTFAEA